MSDIFLDDVLREYRDSSWEPDDSGGSRVLCAIWRVQERRRDPGVSEFADPRYQSEVLPAMNAIVRVIERDFEMFVGTEAAALAYYLALQDEDNRELDDDAMIVIGDWEGHVVGHTEKDNEDCNPMPMHKTVEEVLRRSCLVMTMS